MILPGDSLNGTLRFSLITADVVTAREKVLRISTGERDDCDYMTR